MVFDLTSGTYRSTRYNWASDRKLYEPSEEGSWKDYRDIPIKARHPLELQEGFRRILTDPGGSFKKLSGHDLTLADIYIFPDLMSITDVEESRRIVSSEILTDPIRISGGVLLEGEERIGTSSLLYQLFERYYDRGFVPLLLKGSDLRGTTGKDIDAWIKNAVRVQYGQDALTKFEQLEKSKKLLLLDEFDECSIPAAAFRARGISAVIERFGYLIIAVGELFDLQEVLTYLDANTRRSFHHYRLLPFGFTLRAKLIRRWFQLGAKDGSLDDASLLARCDQAEKLMDVAMVRNIVPSLPLYLLTLLQGIDLGLSGQFQESALGNYYVFLLNEGMRAAGIQPAKWDELTEYSADLAWHFHKKAQRELPKTSLMEFNEKFSKERHTVDFEKRLDELLATRILIKTGDAFRFRYHYIYYLLKGRYLTRNLADADVMSYIEHCCEHLYVRENANTVLFMAHHQVGQPFLMDKIVATLGAQFAAKAPVTFFDDTKGVDQLVRDLPKLEYSGEAPEKHRERVNKLKDKFDDGNDGLIDREEGGAELSVTAQVVMVFKTVEILGQLLQNQYAALPRTRRVEILEYIFNGPLRALRGYFDFLAKKPDAFIAELDAALLERGKITNTEKRQRIARELAAVIVQIPVLGFVLKAALSVSSESLIEDICAVSLKTNTPALRFIELAAILDTLKKLPKDKIERLFDETKGKLIPHRLLQFLILRHLYMFRTREQDKQWLASKEIVGMRTQHAIDLKTAKTKKLKKPARHRWAT